MPTGAGRTSKSAPWHHHKQVCGHYKSKGYANHSDYDHQAEYLQPLLSTELFTVECH